MSESDTYGHEVFFGIVETFQSAQLNIEDGHVEKATRISLLLAKQVQNALMRISLTGIEIAAFELTKFNDYAKRSCQCVTHEI